MLDIQTAEPHATAAPVIIRREDYRAPDWLIPEIALDFQLDAERTIVTARLSVTRNGVHDRPLVLNGEALELLFVSVDGAELPRDQWPEGDAPLTVPLSGAAHVVETKVAISPAKNSQLDGAVRVGRTALHAVRGRRLPPHHLLPRTAPMCSRATALPLSRPSKSALPGAAGPTAIRVARAETPETGRHLGALERPVPQALLPVRAGGGRPAPATRTAFTTMLGPGGAHRDLGGAAQRRRVRARAADRCTSRWRGTSRCSGSSTTSTCTWWSP
jgi:hypothetical protein